MVMAVYAPDSKKSLGMYEECISSVVKVFREGRKAGARDFKITGTDENDNGELTKNVWSLVLARVRQRSRWLQMRMTTGS